ncbi:MAG: hypothetical protein J5642_06860 [Bacteroidales bacterium]|nr:hypothetical protein [Bacteroidales bacterium]
MNDIITYNPFRILNTYTDVVNGAELSMERMSLYAGIYKFAELKKHLGIMQITLESYDNAAKLIQSRSDRIGYAMFWFMKGDDSIEMYSAMGDLSVMEDLDSAMSKLNVIDTTASRINRSVIYLIDNKLNEAVALMNEVLNDDQRRKEFVDAVSKDPNTGTNEHYTGTKEDLMKQYLGLLCCHFPVDDVRAAVVSLPEMSLALQQLVDEKVIDKVENVKQEQEAARKALEVDPSVCFFCGEPTNHQESYQFENKKYEESKIGSGVKETTRTKTIYIPTCVPCKEAIERKTQWKVILTFAFGIIIFVASFIVAYGYFEKNFLLTLLVVVLPGWIVGGLLGYIMSLVLTPALMWIFDRKHCRKFKHHFDDHPHVAKLYQEGYKLK